MYKFLEFWCHFVFFMLQHILLYIDALSEILIQMCPVPACLIIKYSILMYTYTYSLYGWLFKSQSWG